MADALLQSDPGLVAEIVAGPLRVARNNFVERPWGGVRLREFKRLHPLPDQVRDSGLGIGEAFELAAFDADDESARHPSHVLFDDGSSLELRQLLRMFGPRVLGDAFVDRHGACLPLLPKTLSVRELLSVQGHPAGHTEVYVVIDADPGATIALGFRHDVDAADLGRRLSDGLDEQAAFAALLATDADAHSLHNVLTRWFADRGAGPAPDSALLERFVPAGAARQRADRLAGVLKKRYWDALDALNHIEVTAGQVIHNATPARLVADGGLPAAEVHALGNPAGKEVLALEVRLPGPTFRAWDNVRFPRRDVDVGAALRALNLRATAPAEFVAREIPDPNRDGVTCSIDSDFFRVEHLRPTAGTSCELAGFGPWCLHALDGEVTLVAADGSARGTLARGESALVPIGFRGGGVTSTAPAHIVCVTLPN